MYQMKYTLWTINIFTKNLILEDLAAALAFSGMARNFFHRLWIT
jgi:hypothetical protein